MQVLDIVTECGVLAFFLGAYTWSASLRERKLAARLTRLEEQVKHVIVTIAAIPTRQQPRRSRSAA